MKARKLLSLLAVAALLATMLSVISFTSTAAAEYVYDFEGLTENPGWTNFGGGLNMAIDNTVAHSGNNSLKASGQSNTWTSATKDILPIVQANGAGTYTYTAWLRADANISEVCFRLRINGIGENNTAEDMPSFANEGPVNTALCPIRQSVAKDTWTEFTFSFEVTDDDLAKGTSWEPCYCDSPTGVTYWIDDVSLVKGGAAQAPS